MNAQCKYIAPEILILIDQRLYLNNAEGTYLGVSNVD